MSYREDYEWAKGELRTLETLKMKTIALYYQKYNESKSLWETWRTRLNVLTQKKSGHITTLILSREEHIIHLIAHELRHQSQNRRPLKSEWVWGTRGKSTKLTKETDADAYAIRKVREWRSRVSNKAVDSRVFLYLVSIFDAK